MTYLIEIQASFVGIGKSTFVQRFDEYENIDDCIDLVSCFDRWYNQRLVFDDSATDDVLKSMLVMEHVLAKLVAGGRVVMASRSPVVSGFQFSSSDEIADKLIDYYKTRLGNRIKKVIILDYGDAILADEKWIRLGYERMLKRNRKMEMDYFVDYEAYKTFFEVCERKKKTIIDKINRDSFFRYIKISTFHGFNFKDFLHALEIVLNI